LQGRLGQAPDDESLAAECGIPLEQLHRTLADARRQHFLCIHGLSDDEPALGNLAPLSAEPSPEEQAGRHELKELLAKALLELPARDRHVIVLYYAEDLTMKEIAQVLKVTEARVSQIHAGALFRLSMKLNPPETGKTAPEGEGSRT
jgi:RNA polymerase sigma factor for flagellar operon FliA